MSYKLPNSKSRKIRALFIINDNTSTYFSDSRNITYNNNIFFNDKITNKLSNLISDIINNKLEETSYKSEKIKFNIKINNKSLNSSLHHTTNNFSFNNENKLFNSNDEDETNFSFPALFSIFIIKKKDLSESKIILPKFMLIII